MRDRIKCQVCNGTGEGTKSACKDGYKKYCAEENKHYRKRDKSLQQFVSGVSKLTVAELDAIEEWYHHNDCSYYDKDPQFEPDIAVHML
jgi:hypothetical protein